MKSRRTNILILASFLGGLAPAITPVPIPARHIPTPPGTKMLWQVPLHRQAANYSCGAAALKSALAYYGVEVSEEDVLRNSNSTPQNGTEMEPLVAFAEKHGVKAVARTGVTFADLERQVAAGQLTLVTLQAYRDASQATKPYADIWDNGHYLVLVGIDAENLFFVDPAILGHRGFIPRAEFMERWHDTSLTIGNMQQPAILFTGTPNATVWEQIP